MEGRKHPLLTGQLRLLEVSRGEVRNMRGRDGTSSRLEALANDLIGIRLVLSAALLTGGLGAAEREDLEWREREAWELLRGALALKPLP